MATGPEYLDMQVSETGLGDTPIEAIEELRAELLVKCAWRLRDLPNDFKVHP